MAEFTTAHTDTAILDRHLRRVHAGREHEKGSTRKVFRYRLPCGTEIAVEKRQGAPKLYIAASKLPAARRAAFELQVVAGTRTGRNSNLNALDSFRDHVLLSMRVRALADVDKIIAAIV